MALIRENAYVRFILFFIIIYSTTILGEYRAEHETHWMENLFESLIYVRSGTCVTRFLKNNFDNKRTKTE